jgi:hypothetical protein
VQLVDEAVREHRPDQRAAAADGDVAVDPAAAEKSSLGRKAAYGVR